MNFGSFDGGRQLGENSRSQRQRVFKDQRLFRPFRWQISERDLRKTTFFRSKTGPEGCVDDACDCSRVGLWRQLRFALFARFLEMTLEVFFDDWPGDIGRWICWVFCHRLLASEKCLLVNEAKPVAPGVVRVKRSLSPGTSNNIARGGAVNVFSREAVQLARTRVHRFDIVYGEVNVVGKRDGFKIRNVFSVYVD